MRFFRFVSLLIVVSSGGLAVAAPKPKLPSVADCLGCHEDKTAKSAAGHSLFVDQRGFAASVHGEAGLACVDCHTGFNPEEIPHKKKISPVACRSCHDDVGAKHQFHPEIAAAGKAGTELSVDCQSCHGSHAIARVANPAFKLRSASVEACGSCHGDVVTEFRASDHGRALNSKLSGAPDCLTCHRLSVTDGGGRGKAALKLAQEKLCLSCHLDTPSVRDRMPSAGFIRSFESSVHGKALARGDARAPTCADCHSAHGMKRAFDLASSVNRMRIAAVCGKCHGPEAEQFGRSVHGRAVLQGRKDAPTCTDCHGEHQILPRSDPRSPVAAANVSTRVCSPCHASVKLSEKYALPVDRTQSYGESFHGLASREGVSEVANCASCHGAHDVLPSSDPSSRVSAANLVKTCGKCHPGANARFAEGRVHVTMRPKEDPILYVIATIYLILIIGVIGGMLVHNIFDFLRKARHQLAVRRGEIAEEFHGRALYLRMNFSERVQHGLLALSFTVLVVTGFMLRFPDAWWVAGIRKVSQLTIDPRSRIHRIAGVVMIATSLFHVLYAAVTVRGRQLVRDLWLRPSDLREAVGTIGYNLGLRQERPRYGRFSYIEKSEYWALVWGTIVMATTGLIMWFDNTFIGLLTKLGYDVSRVIHYYEAWLATLAILVWHFYFVIFNPDSYPMNMSWLTGKLTEREMAEEHPRELDRLKAETGKEKDEDDGKSS